MTKTANHQDRRIVRTRQSVVRAFVRLVFDRRYDEIRTADLIVEAGIGRSTFYEHFRGKEDVLLAAIEPILLPLANAASGRAGPSVLCWMLEHLWERRALGRIILDSSAGPKLRQRLAAMIEARLEIAGYGPPPLALPAMAAAAGQLAILRMWVAGEVSCSIDGLARQLLAFSHLAPGARSGQPATLLGIRPARDETRLLSCCPPIL
jgi:AcrR family transcriptional regulator